MTFEVWAPLPERVELELAGEIHPMERDGSGWWRSPAAAEAGTDYRFLVDGDPLPDPRSPRQLAGVHGPSRTVDHGAFEWTDARWRGFHLPSAVIYELHTGTFTRAGTFAGAVEQLDRLVELGVDAIEVMPVASFPGRRGWGYDGVHLYAPHEPYGGPDGLKGLVDACHARGLGVVLDVVYNHLGPDGNVLPRYGPYFSERHHTPWGAAVNLDGPGSREVRDLLIGNAEMWLRDYHVDALRLDAVHALVDDSALHFLEELAVRVERLSRALGRPLQLIAESDRNDPRLVRSRESGGFGLHASWSDDLHHALHVALTGERDGYYQDFSGLGDVAAALNRVYVLDGRWSPFRRRVHGRPASGLPGDRFLGYLQNHDQVGNRARGERISHLVPTRRAMAGAALVLAAPTIPMLFQGEEWAASSPFPYFCDHEDPDLARAVTQGRRRQFAAFGWDPDDVPDPQDEATFESAVLDASESGEGAHAEVLDWYRSLIALRRSEPDLRDGDLGACRAVVDEDTGLLVMERGRVAVAVNLGTSGARTSVRPGSRVVLSSPPGLEVTGGELLVPPDGAVFLVADAT